MGPRCRLGVTHGGVHDLLLICVHVAPARSASKEVVGKDRERRLRFRLSSKERSRPPPRDQSAQSRVVCRRVRSEREFVPLRRGTTGVGYHSVFRSSSGEFPRPTVEPRMLPDRHVLLTQVLSITCCSIDLNYCSII